VFVLMQILTMSIATAPAEKDRSQHPLTSSSTPLTTANLAAHEAAIAAAPRKPPNNMQRWLAYTGDKHVQPRETSDWSRLVVRDGLAKEIEIAARGGNSTDVEQIIEIAGERKCC
jgi:hypothetical protein